VTRESIISLLGSDWAAFESLIKEKLATDIRLLQSVNNSILSSSGKRLRPMLTLLVAGALGQVNNDSLLFATGTELMHNATLLHDDVVDNSATRRGKPTVAAVLGPGAAVLIGDYWLSKAVEAITGTRHEMAAIKHMAKTCSDLSSGEILQMQKASTADTTEEDYLRIIYCKTGSLFQTACITGAISVDATPSEESAAEKFGKALGIAFQIRDDILDYSNPEVIGKPVGSDIKEGKITLPLLGAMQNAPQEAQHIRGLMADITDHPEYCEEVRSFVLSHGGLEYASSRLDDFIQEALQALEAFPASPKKEALEALARFNAVRKV